MIKDLLSKLIDAEFPFAPMDRGAIITYELSEGKTTVTSTKMPSLSQLIEECGQKLWGLTRHGNIWQTNWKDGMAGETAGKTPEEAVARLWLAINKK